MEAQAAFDMLYSRYVNTHFIANICSDIAIICGNCPALVERLLFD
jgi:hypothetical protein